MTDTGQVPGEGLPENAGAQPEEQTVVPAASGAYTYADPGESLGGAPVEDEDQLLMPGAQGAWSDAQVAAAQQQAHVPGTHESDGRDSGSIDYGAVRTAHAAPPGSGTPPGGVPAAQEPVRVAAHGAAPESARPRNGQTAAAAPRRPLHLGPPVPEQSGAVRSLADRGPSAAPAAAPEAGPAPAAPVSPVPQVGQQATGLEYLDVAQQGPDQAAGPPLADLPGPSSPEAWAAPATQHAEGAQAVGAHAEVPHAEGPSAAPMAEAPLPGPDLAAVPDAAIPDAAIPDAAVPGVSVPDPAAVPPSPAPAEATPQPAVPDGQGAQQPAAPAPVPASMPDGPVPGAADGTGESGTPGGTAPEMVPAGQQAPAAPQAEAAQPTPPAPVASESAATGAPADSAPQTDPSQDGLPEGPAAGTGTGTTAQEGPAAPQDTPVTPAEGAEVVTVAHTDSEAAPVPGPVDAAVEGGTAGVPSTPAAAPAEAAADAVQAVEPALEPVVEPEPVSPPEPGPVVSERAEPIPQQRQSGSPETVPVPEPAAPAAKEADVPPAPTGAEPAPAPEPAAPAAPAPAPEGASGAVTPQETTPPADTEPQAVPHAGSINEDGPAAPAAPSPDGDAPHATEPATEPAVAPGEAAPGEAAPGYDQADRDAVHRLMRERRDIRKGFRPDPIPHDVLLRVLEAAHTAPSVGHSQPWDFVVIRSEETRRTMHELAQRQRAAYAKSLPKARAKQFKELKVEAILDTPVNILVTADPTRGGRHTLGRHTQPQMAPYSSALAVENLWLAARAEGLGVGWVSFFDEREMVRTLDLPDHLEAVAYLCIGYVDEFPDEPELMQAGWSKRRPLSWVVHEESYGRRALPGAEPHDLLAETLEGIRPLDAKALGEAWERQKRMTKPAGALGMLEIISAQLCGLSRQCPPPIPEPAAVAIFAGDHGVHAQGVTPWPQEVTAQMVANFLGGGAVCNAFANQVGAEVCVIDVGVAGELPATPGLLPRKVRAGTADMTQGPALTREEVLRALEVGIETARDLVAAGNKALVTGEMGIANTTASAALIAVCTGTDPAEVTGRGTGINDETHARKIEVVRQALQLHRPDPADPIGLLAAVGGLEHAALAGLILGGASLRTPVILDGVSAGAAALVARQIAPEALAACVAGHRSAEPGHLAALTKLGLRPLVDLDLRLGEGTGALLALPLVQSAARAMHEVATFDSAGVTEK